MSTALIACTIQDISEISAFFIK